VISNLFLFLFAFHSYASLDLETFCVNPPANMNEVKESLSFLLLKDEKVFVRQKEACIDVVTSPDRVKLLEKFISKRYTLVSEARESRVPDLNDSHCQLEFKTVTTKKSNDDILRSGRIVKITSSRGSGQEVSIAKLLLSLGKPGSLDVGDRSLWVECRRGASGVYQLIFSFTEKDRAQVSSEVSVKANEPLSIAQVTSELNEKNRKLGIPEISIVDSSGQESKEYFLEVK
jgi:hypothetical protein